MLSPGVRCTASQYKRCSLWLIHSNVSVSVCAHPQDASVQWFPVSYTSSRNKMSANLWLSFPAHWHWTMNVCVELIFPVLNANGMLVLWANGRNINQPFYWKYCLYINICLCGYFPMLKDKNCNKLGLPLLIAVLKCALKERFKTETGFQRKQVVWELELMLANYSVARSFFLTHCPFHESSLHFITKDHIIWELLRAGLRVRYVGW